MSDHIEMMAPSSEAVTAALHRRLPSFPNFDILHPPQHTMANTQSSAYGPKMINRKATASCVVTLQLEYVSATHKRAISRMMKTLRRMIAGTAKSARRERMGRSDAWNCGVRKVDRDERRA
jgi:hypothetical protein